MSALLSLMMLAAAQGGDAQYETCMAHATTSMQFRQCGSALVTRREAQLNAVWKKAYATVYPAAKPELLAEQRLWIRFKDKSCGWRANGAYGSQGASIAAPACRAGVLQDRIAYLRGIAGEK